jgi:pyruvate,water dikinase
MHDYIRPFETLTMDDLAVVGGKNASIGEMISRLREAGVRVPGGFATTAAAFREFLAQDGLADRIARTLGGLDVEDVSRLQAAGSELRAAIMATALPSGLMEAITEAYRRLEQEAGGPLSVAVRSSATAEDLPEASFAGQQETVLNVRSLVEVLTCVKRVFASLYNDRAIAYRTHHGFNGTEVALSAGVQRMVRSDLGSSGVAFTIDTETGFADVIFITSTWGLGELLVQGAVNPDEFYLHKPALESGARPILSRTMGTKQRRMVYAPASAQATGAAADTGAFGIDTSGINSETVRVEEVPEAERRSFSLNDEDLITLGRQALTIERHYGRPMDIEWAKDGVDGAIYILQARPETVRSRQAGAQVLERYSLPRGSRVLVRGRSVGARIASGRVRVVQSARHMDSVQPGDILVTDMTDPDWEPVMKRAAAIVTNRGGRTCHAAIIARELDIPAVVGAGDATTALTSGTDVTVCCAEGDEGVVYEGILEINVQRIELGRMPDLPLQIMMNVASPDRAFGFAALPNAGVGLARLEFIINNTIGIHPKALLDYPAVPDQLREEIERRSGGYPNPVEFFVEKLAEGVATIAAAFYPKPVIVRLSDFKSNEYAHLLGGDAYEPREENPMIGFRGASRYRAESFAPCFELECRAIKRVRDEMGLGNVEVMVPFVRTPGELEQVVAIMAGHGLERGRNGLKLVMMCEVPSNALLAAEFLRHVDGFSIGSNDLTQLTLALDRDSGLVADLFDEQDPAVKALVSQAITACREAGKYVGICGQGPSDHPAFAAWLLEEGIDSISLNPDTVLETWLHLAGAEAGNESGDAAPSRAASPNSEPSGSTA